MVDCKFCWHPYCEHAGEQRGFVVDCANFTPKRKPTTNADRIRSMSDEELCEMLTMGTGGFDCGVCRDSNACDRECELHCAEWLKRPVKDGDNDG